MTTLFHFRATYLSLAVLGWVLVLAPTAQAGKHSFESPPVFRAAELLPAKLLSGPNYRVDDRVENDGLMNHYTISSRFGTVSAVSDDELRERVYEMGVVAVLDKLKGTDEFAKNIGKTAGNVVEGGKALITEPGKTISGAVSGIGKLFQRAGDAVAGDPASDSEGSGLDNLTGFSATKRAYAAEFGVDPYSTNPILQESLEEIARAGNAGGIVASVALMAVPGGAGVMSTCLSRRRICGA